MDFKKLIKVIATIVGISVLAIFFTILASKLTQRFTSKSKQKEESLPKGKMSLSGAAGGVSGSLPPRLRTSSSASSTTQMALHGSQSRSQLAKKSVVMMPPSVIPEFSVNSKKKSLNHSFNTAPDLLALRKNLKNKNEESLHLMHENLSDTSNNNLANKPARI